MIQIDAARVFPDHSTILVADDETGQEAVRRQDPQRRLACAVIWRAFQDLKDGSQATRLQARVWLQKPSEDLVWWCAVAGIPTERVLSAYTRGVKGGRRAGLRGPR